MKKLGISKVMLSTLITGGALFGASTTMASAPAPSNREGDTEIDLPPSAFVYSSLEDKKELVQEMKTEAQEIQFEREELARKLEEERIRIEKEKEQQRLKKIAEAEAAKKKKEEELRKAKIESEGQTFEASYYTPYCKGCTGKTKTGHNVKNSIYYEGMRIIAADPSVIPLYSIVEISSSKGSFTAIVLDVGSAINGKKIDVLVADKKTAYDLGRHDVKLKIVRKGKK